MSNGFLRKSLQEQKTSLMQGPLKKWTEHSIKSIFKVHTKRDPNQTQESLKKWTDYYFLDM